jgi:hypothetical protein
MQPLWHVTTLACSLSLGDVRPDIAWCRARRDEVLLRADSRACWRPQPSDESSSIVDEDLIGVGRALPLDTRYPFILSNYDHGSVCCVHVGGCMWEISNISLHRIFPSTRTTRLTDRSLHERYTHQHQYYRNYLPHRTPPRVALPPAASDPDKVTDGLPSGDRTTLKTFKAHRGPRPPTHYPAPSATPTRARCRGSPHHPAHARPLST